MAVTARDPRSACRLSCGGMAIQMAGGDALRVLMVRSGELCRAWIPGFEIVADGPRRRLPVLCRVVLGHRRVPRAAFTARPPTLRIEGDVSLLGPEALADLSLSLFARFLQKRDGFLVDGSAALVRGKVVVLTSPSGAERSAAALQLAGRGHEILATNRCLLSKGMKLLAGTNAFQPEPRTGSECPASLHGTGRPIGAPFPGKPPTVCRVLHLHLGESTSEPREIDRPTRKLVMSSNVVSRLTARPAVIAPWGLFLPLVTPARDVRRRHEAILNMAALPQASLYCRPADLEVMLEKIL